LDDLLDVMSRIDLFADIEGVAFDVLKGKRRNGCFPHVVSIAIRDLNLDLADLLGAWQTGVVLSSCTRGLSMLAVMLGTGDAHS
jgi:hypothetical protein